MLKKKLSRSIVNPDPPTTTEPKQLKSEENGLEASATNITTSVHFPTPFWKRLYDLEGLLNESLHKLQAPSTISHIYNPIEYAAELHCAYLRLFLNGPKALVFVGMNPGPNGMGQTGVPFGNIGTVRDIMQLSGKVQQPPHLHHKRPVSGLMCKTEEPSGVRIWSVLQRLAGGSLQTFAQKCFVHNFCPLAFFNKDGKNITPSELKGDYKMQIRDICLQSLDAQITLLQPEIVVAVGDYVFTSLKKSVHATKIKMLRLAHPSPRSLNNQNWAEKAEQMLHDNDLVKYIQNVI